MTRYPFSHFSYFHITLSSTHCLPLCTRSQSVRVFNTVVIHTGLPSTRVSHVHLDGDFLCAISCTPRVVFTIESHAHRDLHFTLVITSSSACQPCILLLCSWTLPLTRWLLRPLHFLSTCACSRSPCGPLSYTVCSVCVRPVVLCVWLVLSLSFHPFCSCPSSVRVGPLGHSVVVVVVGIRTPLYLCAWTLFRHRCIVLVPLLFFYYSDTYTYRHFALHTISTLRSTIFDNSSSSIYDNNNVLDLKLINQLPEPWPE